MSNPADVPKPPYRFSAAFAWPTALTGGRAGAPERMEQTLRDWLNLQRDFAAAYARWLEQLRECRNPADFMHAQQSGLALWTQWIGCAVSALSTEVTESANAATELAQTLTLPAAIPSPDPASPAEASPPKAPRKRTKTPRPAAG